MKDLKEFLTLIWEQIVNPYWKTVDEKKEIKEELPGDFCLRIKQLSIIRKQLLKIREQVPRRVMTETEQGEERQCLEDCLNCFERLLNQQQRFNRMMSHQRIGHGVDIKEHKRVGFEIDCLEKLVEQYFTKCKKDLNRGCSIIL